MYFRQLLAFVAIAILHSASLAQVIPAPNIVERRTSEYNNPEAQVPVICVEDQLIRYAFVNGKYGLMSSSIATGKPIAEVVWENIGTGRLAYLMTLGGKGVAISTRIDKDSSKFSIYGLLIDPYDLSPIGSPRLLGEVQAKEGSLKNWYESSILSLNVLTSPSGEYGALFRDVLSSDSPDRMAFMIVFNTDLNVEWSANHPTGLKKKYFYSRGLLLDDEGSIHRVTLSEFPGRESPTKYKNMTHEVTRYSAGGVASFQLLLPGNSVVDHVHMMQSPTGRIVVGGTYIKADVKPKGPVGLFVGELTEGSQQVGSYVETPFTTPPKMGYAMYRVLPRPNGGTYILVQDERSASGITRSKSLWVWSFNEDGGVEWSRSFPHNVTFPYQHMRPDLTSILLGDDLWVAFESPVKDYKRSAKPWAPKKVHRRYDSVLLRLTPDGASNAILAGHIAPIHVLTRTLVTHFYGGYFITLGYSEGSDPKASTASFILFKAE